MRRKKKQKKKQKKKKKKKKKKKRLGGRGRGREREPGQISARNWRKANAAAAAAAFEQPAQLSVSLGSKAPLEDTSSKK